MRKKPKLTCEGCRERLDLWYNFKDGPKLATCAICNIEGTKCRLTDGTKQPPCRTCGQPRNAYKRGFADGVMDGVEMGMDRHWS